MWGKKSHSSPSLWLVSQLPIKVWQGGKAHFHAFQRMSIYLCSVTQIQQNRLFMLVALHRMQINMEFDIY